MKYKEFTARELFTNDKLSHLFPQFKKSEQLKNVYSFADTERRIQEYLSKALSGTVTGLNEIRVIGKQKAVLANVRRLQPLLEQLFNNTHKITTAIRRNSKIYLPYASLKQLQDVKTGKGKAKVLQAITENLQYNDELNALNSIKKEPIERFMRGKRAFDARRKRV